METDDDAAEVTDYDYDANFGVVLNENELPPPDFEDQAAPKAPPSYDYSHFDVYNSVSAMEADFKLTKPKSLLINKVDSTYVILLLFVRLINNSSAV
jgi:hypothetical protein